MIRITRKLPTLLLLLVVLALVVVSCARPTTTPTTTTPTPSQPTPSQPPPTTTQPATPLTPTLKITQPTSGATLTPGDIQVTVEVSNFELVALGAANAEGQGHIHYYLDVAIPTTPGQPAIAAAGTYQATNQTTVTWDNVGAGSHTLGVQLVNNDHTPLSPAVTTQITVNVEAAAATTTTTTTTQPSVKIIQPAAGVNPTAGNIQVTVEASNFELVAPGGANALGQGHLHYYLDVEIPTAAGQPAFTAVGTYKASPGTTVTWDNVAAGTHTFGVQLVNNDHTPLSPPVTAQVTVDVTAQNSSEPSVRIIQPAAGTILPPGSIQVTVEVSNFQLVAPGGANAPGQGHLHYYLDVEIPTTQGQPATTALGTYKASPGTTVTWDNVAAGTHTFGVQLVNSDHTPLSTPVTTQITITVGVGGGGIYNY